MGLAEPPLLRPARAAEACAQVGGERNMKRLFQNTQHWLHNVRNHPGPSWSSLSRLGKNRVLRTSFIWIVAAPILASVWTTFGPAADVALPVDWRFLYLAIIAFSLASLIYWLKCPEIIRAYRGFGDYIREGKGAREVIDYMWPLVRMDAAILRSEDADSATQDSAVNRLVEFYGRLGGELNPAHADKMRHDIMQWPPLGLKMIWETQTSEGQLGDAFWFVRAKYDPAKEFWYEHRRFDRWSRLARLTCWLFYAAGFALVGKIMLDSIYYVLLAA